SSSHTCMRAMDPPSSWSADYAKRSAPVFRDRPCLTGPCIEGRTYTRSVAHELRKTVTVVFVDVTDSTRLAEGIDSEPLRRVMLRYFDTVSGVLRRHGGTVEKFIGDAVMAVFGVPTVHEDDALRAARAAVEVQEAIAHLNDELQREHGVRIEVRT